MNKSYIKGKKEKIFYSSRQFESKIEKLLLNFEINNCVQNNIYTIKFINSDKIINNKINQFEIKNSDNSVSSLHLCKLECDYCFEKEQKLNMEININDNKKIRTNKIETSLAEIVGNENKSKNGTKIFNFSGAQEILKIKPEKIKNSRKSVIFHFTLKIVPELNIQKKYEYFKNEEYKIYYIIEKEGQKLYESDTFTDNGKFYIVQIPIDLLNLEFNILFYNAKNNQIGCLKTNVKDFTDPEKRGHIFFINRLSINESLYIYNFSTVRDEITLYDYISKGVRVGLNIGIDFTQSNLSTNDPNSLHCLLKEKRPNPYERAIKGCGNILAYYDYDQLIPVYGFGAVIKGKYKTSMCFNINFKEDPNIQNVDNIIKEYVNCMSKIDFACPTYFAPIINKIISDIKKDKDILNYQLLLILTDGMIQDLDDTIEALVEGSFYPLSVVIVGIGKADFSKMEQLDGDEIPLISKSGIKRLRDLVQFVPFSKFELNEKKLSEAILEELPRQVIEYYTFNFLYPEIINGDFIKKNNIIDNINNENPLDTSNIQDKSSIFLDTSFLLFDQNKKRDNVENEDAVWNYDEINLMFKNTNIKDNNVHKTASQKINRENLKKYFLKSQQ